MGEKTGIAWTDSTWNPVRGCSKVSAGCKNCYAETFAERWRGIPGHAFERGFDLRLVPEALGLPLRWRKPRRIFVNSMSDLFHDAVPFDFIDRVFGVMGACYQHTFQILTKRAARMREYLSVNRRLDWAYAGALGNDQAFDRIAYREGPLPNVWLGVSVEDQRAADERIPELLATPAAVRFLSCEPLLGSVDLTPEAYQDDGESGPGRWVDWVIVGGESGPGARLCDIAWVRSLVGQCKAAGVPAFVKQLGARPVDSDWRAGVYAPADRRSIAAAADLGAATHPNILVLRDRAGRDPGAWPADLRVQQFPEVNRG